MNPHNSDGTNGERLLQAGEWLQRLSDESDSESAFLEWQAWCKADRANVAAFERIQDVWQRIDPELIERIRAQRKTERPRRPIALAAALLVTLGAAASWFLLRPAPSLEWRTGVGEVRHEVLADGSSLDLGADSRIVIQYSESRRHIELIEGRALFTVARDSSRPFTVNAGGIHVTAIGTAFDVRTTRASTIVTVGEGRVRIGAPELQRAAQSRSGVDPVLVSAGERVRYSKQENALSVSRIDRRLTDSWRAGILQFQEEPLQDVVNEVNRYVSRKIVIDDPGIGQRSYTGTIAADRVEEWLSALESMMPVTIEDQNRSSIRITRKPPLEVDGH